MARCNFHCIVIIILQCHHQEHTHTPLSCGIPPPNSIEMACSHILAVHRKLPSDRLDDSCSSNLLTCHRFFVFDNFLSKSKARGKMNTPAIGTQDRHIRALREDFSPSRTKLNLKTSGVSSTVWLPVAPRAPVEVVLVVAAPRGATGTAPATGRRSAPCRSAPCRPASPSPRLSPVACGRRRRRGRRASNGSPDRGSARWP